MRIIYFVFSLLIGLLFGLFFSSFSAHAQTTYTTNMSLPVSTIGQASGLTWEQNLNAALRRIDQHNHSSGYGVQITPNGLSINADLPFQSHNATQLRTSRYTPQVSTIPNAGQEVCEIYTSGNELYYNDCTGGNVVKITTNGSVNAGAGSIGGLPSGTASVAYSAGKYTFQSATNVAANIDGRNHIFRNSSASSYGLTLSPPAAMAANITETLPTIPGAESFITMDSSGNFLSAIPVAGGITGNNIDIETITGSNIEDGAITTTQINAAAGILPSQIAGTWNIHEFKTNGTTSWVVPVGVTTAQILGCGGGGGGGAGAGGAGGGAGGGGSASPLSPVNGISLTPNSTVTIIIADGGGGGAGIIGSGPAGSTGGTTSFASISFYGGGGGGGSASTGGGTAGHRIAGGADGGAGGTAPNTGTAGDYSVNNPGGAAGSGAGAGNGAGGGGGGGSAFAAGGAGASGGTSGNHGGDATAAGATAYCIGGGGGGGAGAAGSTRGGNGAKGGTGYLSVMWWGLP